MNRKFVVLIGVSAAFASCATALLYDGWFPLRMGLCGAGLAYAGAAALLPARLVGWPPVSFAMALGGGSLAALSLLDLLLAHGDVYARGVLGAACVAALLSLLTFIALRARPTQGRATRVVQGVLVLTTATTGALTLVESGFRARFPLLVYEIVPDDRSLGEAFEQTQDGQLVGRPGFRGEYRHPEFPGVRIDLNAWGLRDGLDEAVPPSADALRVLVLGDSFAFGCGVPLEATFQELLEGRAGEPGARPLSVTCVAMPGNGQFHELHDLERFASRVTPAIVVVAFYMGNDFADNLGWEWRAAREQGLIPAAALKPAISNTGPRLPRLLTGLLRPPFWLGGCSTVAVLLPRLEQTLVRHGLTQRFVPMNGFLADCMKKDPPLMTAQLGRSRTLLVCDTLRDRCLELGARPVMLLIPAAIQASPPRFGDFAATRDPADAATYDRRAFHDDFARRLRDRGWHIADPIDALEAEENAGRPCYHREGHWNERGHQVAAEVLARSLRQWLQSGPDGG